MRLGSVDSSGNISAGTDQKFREMGAPRPCITGHPRSRSSPVLSTPPACPPPSLAAWWCSQVNISKMQIMTPAPLTSCAFVYVRENDNYYEKNNQERHTVSGYIGQEQTFWVSALGLSHISPTRWLILCPPNECLGNGDCLACFMGLMGSSERQHTFHSVRGQLHHKKTPLGGNVTEIARFPPPTSTCPQNE